MEGSRFRLVRFSFLSPDGGDKTKVIQHIDCLMDPFDSWLYNTVK
jgi:hypothetical protein